jgi:hypothetical protein
MNEAQIEALLRSAPRPPAPANLQRELQAAIHLPRAASSAAAAISTAPLWQRWFPALSFGLLFLGCLMVLGVQTFQVLDLRRERDGFQAAAAKLEELRREHLEWQRLRSALQNNEGVKEENEELVKLRAEATELRSRAQEFRTLRAENERLRAEHAAMLARAGVPPAEDPFTKAKEKAEATRCINNLKQIGLAARIWADVHKSNLLPVDWLAMKNELVTPRILTCPGDLARTQAASWDQFDGSSVSYELPSAAPDVREPNTVYTRCTIHGSIGMTDGSAIMKMNPAQFQRIDGNLKLRNHAATGAKP